MNYRERLIDHLANYKLTELGIAEPGIFKHRGRELPSHHILPLQHRNLNLLELVRRDVLDHVRTNGLQLHRYFHHLNSSQAFAFNLFFPYFAKYPESAPRLLKALGQSGSVAQWKFEWVPDLKEGTNIDVMWSSLEGQPTLCEVKLSELDVGSAKQDERHLRKLEEIYAPGLNGYIDPDELVPERFFKSYQFYRNLLHITRTPGARLIFLAPRSNKHVWRRLTVLVGHVSHETTARIFTVAVEDVLASLICDQVVPELLRQHARALAQKYLV